MHSSFKRLAPENVVFRPLKRLNVVTTAVAWNSARANPLVDAIIAKLGAVSAPSRKAAGAKHA